MGYNLNYNGYRCLNLDTRCVFLTRHVVFNEHVFPFKTFKTSSLNTAPESTSPMVLVQHKSVNTNMLPHNNLSIHPNTVQRPSILGPIPHVTSFSSIASKFFIQNLCSVSNATALVHAKFGTTHGPNATAHKADNNHTSSSPLMQNESAPGQPAKPPTNAHVPDPHRQQVRTTTLPAQQPTQLPTCALDTVSPHAAAEPSIAIGLPAPGLSDSQIQTMGSIEDPTS